MLLRLDKDTITPELQRLLREVKRPRSLYAAGAKAVQKGIVAHLIDLQSRGNRRGWPDRKFFSGGPDSVRKRVGIASLTDTGATITIADPRFVHRILGGTVSAKRARLLAIPLTAEAYAAGGKGTVRESMPDLVMIKTRKGLYLARTTDNRGKGQDQLRVLFKLVPRATHRPHPDEQPKLKVLSAAAQAAMLKAAAILLRADQK